MAHTTRLFFFLPSKDGGFPLYNGVGYRHTVSFGSSLYKDCADAEADAGVFYCQKESLLVGFEENILHVSL